MAARAFSVPETPEVPLYRARALTGALPEFREDPVAFFGRVFRRTGDLARFRLGPRWCYAVRQPEHVKHVLVDHQRNYGKQTTGYDKLRLFLGNGLVTSEGDFWRRQRRIAQPSFHRRKIQGFVQTMARQTQQLLHAWGPIAARGEVVDVHEAMMGLTLRIVASTVLSIEVADKERAVEEAVGFMQFFANDALKRIFPLHEVLPTPQRRQFLRHAAALDDMVFGSIAERRSTGVAGNDLLSMLMETEDEETGERMTDQQLRDEVMTMFIAGHETTASALSFTLTELARTPHVVAKLREELDAVLGERSVPGVDDLKRLPYTTMVFREGMRLYPPAWLLARSVAADDVLGGYRIRKGGFVFLSPFHSHRHPGLWPDPEVFDPERFRPEAMASRPRYAYFPFSGGPRQCIGNVFAEMEGALILAAIMGRFDVALEPDYEVQLDPLVTLRPRGGIRARLRPR